MTIDKDKKRVQITISKVKYKELKKIAVDKETTISELLLTASDSVLNRVVGNTKEL